MNPVRWLRERLRPADGLEAEIREHLAEKAEELVTRGMSPEDAAAAARREFGNLTLIEERSRAVWLPPTLDNWLMDLRYGLRVLRKAPGFTAVAVLTLALGIGSNTAIFTLINAVMLQRLPVKDPGRLALFYDGIDEGVISGDRSFPVGLFSHPCWEFFREHAGVLQSLSAFQQSSDSLIVRLAGSSEKGAKEQARGHLVAGEYFKVLGVDAAAGRLLAPEDDRPAAPPVAVISYRYWRRRFKLDRSAVGRAVDVNGTHYTVVGVAAPEFFGVRVQQPPDFWLPLSRQPEILRRESWLGRRDVYWLNMVGRLKPGVTLEAAEAALNAQLRQFYAEQAGPRISPDTRRLLERAHLRLRPGARGISSMRARYSEPLHLLLAVVGLVLLIACANVATLLLARASARRQEFWARLALGASRGRLVRQLLTESVLLALAGGVVGVGLSWWSIRAVAPMIGVSSVVNLSPDLRVLCFTLVVCVVTGVGFGLAPALLAGRLEWKPGSASSSREFGVSRVNPAHALVVVQVALSSVLLVGAGLLAHSLFDLQSQNLGFKQDNLLLVRTDPRLAGYRPVKLGALYRRMQDRLSAIPGVVSVAVAGYSPLSGGSSSGNFSVEGYEPPPGKEMKIYIVEAGPRFFEVLGIPVLLGRGIGERDTPGSPPVAVVSESFVKQYLPGENPIGRHFRPGAPFRAPGFEIVGVAADSKFYNLRDEAKPMAFFALWQGGGREAYAGEVMLRISRDPASVLAEVRRALREIDSRLPVLSTTTLREQVRGAVEQERTMAELCGCFGLLALVLAAIGLYGTMAYAVVRRTSEIGIRMALGAPRAGVLWLMLRQALLLVVIGLACGLPLAIAASRWIKSFLFGVQLLDPVGIGAAVALLAAVSALAGYLPAWRATRVDPITTLRHD